MAGRLRQERVIGSNSDDPEEEEDDLDEEHRRLSATLREFKASPRDLEGRITIVGPEQVGTLVHRDPQSGRIQITPTLAALEGLLTEQSTDILMLDPLVELHTSEENDNTGLRAVIAAFRSLAQRHNIAVVLFHHTRKGSTTPGDPDAIRGAGAIVGAARMVFTLCVMTDEEAGSLSIPVTQRRNYFRLDSAKSNYAPGTDAEWFERIPYELKPVISPEAFQMLSDRIRRALEDVAQAAANSAKQIREVDSRQ